MFDLTGKVAVVTGGSKGLGRAVAKTLAKANAHVVITSRNEKRLQEVQQEIQTGDGQATVIPSDMKEIASIRNLHADVKRRFGRLDILVNNAGTTVAKKALDMTEEDWQHVLDTNLTGLFFSCQSAAEMMKDQGNGRIVNLASVMGAVGDISVSPYAASKGGVVQLTKALAVEWARYNINVNAVGPGYIKTDMNRDALETNEKFHNHVIQKTPLRRLGKPEDVGAAVLYLCSDEANYVTGHTLFVDGGWLAQ